MMKGPGLRPVDDEQLNDHVHAICCRVFNYDARRHRHMPFDNPVSVDSESARQLATKKYIVAHKANGTRMVLVLTMYKDEPIAVLADRNRNMHAIYCYARASLFQDDSVFDGELVRGVRSSSFLVFNCLMIRGRSLAPLSYTDRLREVDQHIAAGEIEPARRDKMANFFILSPVPGLTIIKKETELARNLRSFQRSVIPHYPCDGLVFTPADEPVKPGRQEHLLKWKTENTVDVLVTIEWDGSRWVVVSIQVDDGGRNVPFDETGYRAGLSTVKGGFARVLDGYRVYCELFRDPAERVTFRYVIEVSCQITNQRDVLMRYCKTRVDKDGPNNVNTVDRTIGTIINHVTMEDIYSLVQDRRPTVNFADDA